MGYITLDTVSELFIYPKFWDTSDPDPSNHVPLISPQFLIPGPVTYGYGNLDGTDTTYYPANFLHLTFQLTCYGTSQITHLTVMM